MHQPVSRRILGLIPQEWALVAITAVWGGTFLVVHTAMQHSGPWFFVGFRFLAAGLFASAIFWRSLRGIGWREIGAGAAIGAAIYGGYGLQTAGLQTIDSSTSAFMTAFYVPLVPLLQWLVLRKPPRALTLVGAGLAFVGLLLVAGIGSRGIQLGEGELLTLISTLPIAGEIILISMFGRPVRRRPAHRRAAAHGRAARVRDHAGRRRADPRVRPGLADHRPRDGARERPDPAHDELGAALGLRDPRDHHLHRRAGVGGGGRPHRGGDGSRRSRSSAPR